MGHETMAPLTAEEDPLGTELDAVKPQLRFPFFPGAEATDASSIQTVYLCHYRITIKYSFLNASKASHERA